MHRSMTRLAVVLILYLASGCAGPTRSPPVPPGSALVVPWGAWSRDEMERLDPGRLDERLTPEILDEVVARLERDADGRLLYPTLALSVGGARGAYGAGVLAGWTESGTRPVFEQVTAGSAGALMATAAFLGPEYDWMLRKFFVELDPMTLLREKSKLNLLFSDSFVDRSGMADALEQYITEEVVDAVARGHNEGRDLFVGTVNLDQDEFVIWDMGAIAASRRLDRVERFRRVIMASSAVPGVFEPVYFDVEVAGEQYSQMHVDGGVKEAVFLRRFMLDADEALSRTGFSREQFAPHLYVVMNDSFAREVAPVEPRGLDIIGASLSSVYTANRRRAVERTYMLAREYDVAYHLTAMPDDFAAIVGPSDFDADAMAQLFELGRERGRGDSHWLDAPPSQRGISIERRRLDL